ncbi:zinc finger protein [Culex quinquefasciatus]|uniref:Zinc finger protein n=1 Tax=Culex quinquefasciatus TaxID=7176 RepID=B0XFG4_CULQU|nr:zinc finger protein [Culex quinquefasciatus]|eukprot:XP_001868386.1 zinc finger protein [Culex quinquefasciatus]
MCFGSTRGSTNGSSRPSSRRVEILAVTGIASQPPVGAYQLPDLEEPPSAGNVANKNRPKSLVCRDITSAGSASRSLERSLAPFDRLRQDRRRWCGGFNCFFANFNVFRTFKITITNGRYLNRFKRVLLGLVISRSRKQLCLSFFDLACRSHHQVSKAILIRRNWPDSSAGHRTTTNKNQRGIGGLDVLDIYGPGPPQYNRCSSLKQSPESPRWKPRLPKQTKALRIRLATSSPLSDPNVFREGSIWTSRLASNNPPRPAPKPVILNRKIAASSSTTEGITPTETLISSLNEEGPKIVIKHNPANPGWTTCRVARQRATRVRASRRGRTHTRWVNLTVGLVDDYDGGSMQLGCLDVIDRRRGPTAGVCTTRDPRNQFRNPINNKNTLTSNPLSNIAEINSQRHFGLVGELISRWNRPRLISPSPLAKSNCPTTDLGGLRPPSPSCITHTMMTNAFLKPGYGYGGITATYITTSTEPDHTLVLTGQDQYVKFGSSQDQYRYLTASRQLLRPEQPVQITLLHRLVSS